MSNETKRGAPTEDGEWEVLFKNGNCAVIKKCGQRYTYTNDQLCYAVSKDIIAHRKHDPLVVPELKKLHRCHPGRECVVRVTRSGDKSMDGVYAAVNRVDGSYLIHTQDHCVPQFAWSTTAELTRAECEEAGYEYLEECQ